MKLHTSQNASIPALENLPCAAGTEYKIGMGLVVSAGAAAKVGATATPEYICMSEKKGVAGQYVQAIRVLKGETYEAKLSEAGSALKIGNKVTIDADGIRVTATTASGVAQITGFMTEEQAAGDAVLVKF